MVRASRIAFLLVVLLIGAWGADFHSADDADGLPIVRVGIVYDGPAPGGTGVLPERFAGLVALIRRETAALTNREFDVRFPQAKQ